MSKDYLSRNSDRKFKRSRVRVGPRFTLALRYWNLASVEVTDAGSCAWNWRSGPGLRPTASRMQLMDGQSLGRLIMWSLARWELSHACILIKIFWRSNSTSSSS